MFSWKYSSVFGIAICLLGITFTLSSHYLIAVTCYVLGGIWLLGWCFFEESVAPSKKSKQRKNKQKIIKAVLIVFLAAFAIVWTFHLKNDAELHAYSGAPLVPGKEATPLNDCLHGNETGIFLGSNVYSGDTFPHEVLRMNGDTLLQINQDSKNDLYLAFRVFDERGDIIARMPDSPENRASYWIRPDSRMYRKNRHSLIVYDHTDREVLNVEFLNEHAIRVTGIFREPSDPRSSVEINTDNATYPDGGTVSGGCTQGLKGPDVDVKTH